MPKELGTDPGASSDGVAVQPVNVLVPVVAMLGHPIDEQFCIDRRYGIHPAVFTEATTQRVPRASVRRQR
ncbi:hypothetical protein [Stieleria magnilauensis]|uniref:hypothetical protein n=1 Tax=Stieleria magnilauensis TaxID=2527963 RepID=UPI003AF6B519